MKPTKNKIFCIGCKRSKMLFESQAKADNFIKFNSDDIAAQSHKVPTRSYYCSFCCGWHITSVAEESRAKEDDKRDERLWGQIHTFMRQKLPNDEVVRQVTELIHEIDELLNKCEGALWKAELLEAQDFFKECTLKFSIIQQLISNLNKTFTLVERRRSKITSYENIFESIDNYILDEDARNKYLEEHSTPKAATTVSHYFRNKSFLDDIQSLFVQAQNAYSNGDISEVTSLRQIIEDKFKNTHCIGLSKKRKYYEQQFEELLKRPVKLKKTKADIDKERKLFLNIIDILEQAYEALNNGDKQKCISLIKTAECLLPGNNDDTEQILLAQINALKHSVF